jgi:hypothetical protein
LICLLVASADSTTSVKTHITTTKITVNDQHGINAFESATTDSDPIAARSASGDPITSVEEEKSDLGLSKRFAQSDVPPPGQSAVGTGDTNPTSGIPGSSEPESMAGSSSSVGSANSSSQSRTEPESTLGSQDTHSSNLQNATGVSGSNTSSTLLTQSGSGETSRTGALPISNTTGVGIKPGNNTTSSSLTKLPFGTGQNTTMVATPSSGPKSSVASTQIPISSISSASSTSATILTSVIISNESSRDTGNSDNTATTSSFSSGSRNVSIMGTKTLSDNSSAVLSTTASPPDTQVVSLNSAHNISSSISSTTTSNSSTTGSGTSDTDSVRLSTTSSLATASDSSLQPSSISISDRRNFTALTPASLEVPLLLSPFLPVPTVSSLATTPPVQLWSVSRIYLWISLARARRPCLEALLVPPRDRVRSHPQRVRLCPPVQTLPPRSLRHHSVLQYWEMPSLNGSRCRQANGADPRC